MIINLGQLVFIFIFVTFISPALPRLILPEDLYRFLYLRHNAIDQIRYCLCFCKRFKL